MEYSDRSSEVSRPFLTWQRIVDWAQTHYRERTFRKDERIPTRSGLLYLVNQGSVRLVGTSKTNIISNDEPTETSDKTDIDSDAPEEAFLGFVDAGQPFEIVVQSSFNLQAYAHVDQTVIIWMYWHDLENWPHFRQEVFEAFRYQHQRKLLWLSALGQRKTIDRLISFLTLLVEEYGKPADRGYYLPYMLTHAQIGSAIGSTRVTVTRLLGKLRKQGFITIKDDNLICLPHLSQKEDHNKHDPS
ncbi:MAG: Crp/Fnr family transcriptional regulator [Xenococcaceae cyanobacterium]